MLGHNSLENIIKWSGVFVLSEYDHYSLESRPSLECGADHSNTISGMVIFHGFLNSEKRLGKVLDTTKHLDSPRGWIPAQFTCIKPSNNT